jgi:hypothetical protein
MSGDDEGQELGFSQWKIEEAQQEVTRTVDAYVVEAAQAKKKGPLEEDNRMSRKPEDGDASLSYKRKAGGESWEVRDGSGKEAGSDKR